MLTARHVVDGCGALFVIKDGRVARAVLVAQSEAEDLAVLGTLLKPYLSAVLAAPGAGAGAAWSDDPGAGRASGTYSDFPGTSCHSVAGE